MSGEHWWWEVPEFLQAQRDPGFRAWVQSIELGMDLGEEPFDEIIPGLPVRDPFSDEVITLAERAFLNTFADERDLDSDWHLTMRFIKYLGQAYVDKLECRWVFQPILKGTGGRQWGISTPAIDRPWPTDMLYDLVPTMTATVDSRRGDDWFYVFSNNRKGHVEWVSAGRPGYAAWKAHDQQIRADQN